MGDGSATARGDGDSDSNAITELPIIKLQDKILPNNL